MGEFSLRDWFLPGDVPHAKRAVVATRKENLFIDELHTIDAARMSVVNQLRLIDNLPDTKRSIRTA